MTVGGGGGRKDSLLLSGLARVSAGEVAKHEWGGQTSELLAMRGLQDRLRHPAFRKAAFVTSG